MVRVVKRISSRTLRSQRAAARRIYRRLEGARGLDDHERWQHALFFAKSPDERCRVAVQTARLAISFKRSGSNR
jgi:hypothetical protein